MLTPLFCGQGREDENLLALRFENSIATWCPGRVCYIADLHPSAVITFPLPLVLSLLNH